MKPLHCDVLVVGGGAAGVAAAAAAGRAGARVVLLERYGFLGGLATAGWVGTLCGLYRCEPGVARPRWVSHGFPREFAARLMQSEGSEPLGLSDGLWVLPFSTRAFERISDEVLTEAGNVTLRLHSTVTGIDVWETSIREVCALAWNELIAIRPETVVDCTGEATVVRLAGGTVVDGARDQAAALVFIMEQVDGTFDGSAMLDVWCTLRRAVEQQRLAPGSDRLALVPGRRDPGRIAFKLNLPLLANPDSDGGAMTAWEREGRGRVREIERVLRDSVTAFRHARVLQCAPQVGVRSGRRIQGHGRLAEQAVLEGRKSLDGVARGCWPVERWTDGARPSMDFLPPGEHYDVPLDCLRPMTPQNVWAAGRCFSAEAGAMASARVLGTVLATGWAAGYAAALQTGGLSGERILDRIREHAEPSRPTQGCCAVSRGNQNA